MLVFTLFALINLCIGYAVAVLLGHGPNPWYAIFLPARGSDVVQIDALEAETEQPSDMAAEHEDEPVSQAPATVNYPFPEMNEPEGRQPGPESSEDELPVDVHDEQPEPEPHLDLPDERPAPVNEDDDDIEKFLAAGQREPTPEPAESLSTDEIASMFATQDAVDEMEAAEETSTQEDSADEDSARDVEPPGEASDETDETADTPEPMASQEEAPPEEEAEATLDQDDIAALFNQV